MTAENRPGITRVKNVTDIRSGNRLNRFVYSAHNRPQPVKDLPKNFDGLILETAEGNYVTNPEEAFGECHRSIQYKQVIESLQGKGKPIYLLDAHFKRPGFVALAEIGLLATEVTLGGILMSVGDHPDLLKTAVSYLAGLYFMEPFVAGTIGRAVSMVERGYDFSSWMNNITSYLHPEIFSMVIGLRNSVIAHKKDWLSNYLGDNMVLTTIIGHAHTQVEDGLLSSPFQRLNYLKGSRWLWRRIVKPETMYSIQRYDYRKGRWIPTETLEVPDLKELSIAK